MATIKVYGMPPSTFTRTVLLAAQENPEEALAVCAQIREIKPRQRIALLVGPPAFIRELGGKRKKAESIREVLPSPAAEIPSEPVSAPQWQETVRRLVCDWYADQSSVLKLPRLTGGIADA